MLILNRKFGEKIIIGDDIEIMVLGTTRGQVRIGITAPSGVTVHREEIYIKIKEGTRDKLSRDEAAGGNKNV